MIKTIIFSKNRAAQLDLLLRSIKDNFSMIYDISILYKSTSQCFTEGYDKVKSKFPDLDWVEETDFVHDYKTILNDIISPYTLILVDDEVVVDDCMVDNALSEMVNKNLHCISLRMHPNVNYCYTANLPSPEMQPSYVINDWGYVWNWKHYDERIDLGYPSCINSHIYPTHFIQHFSKVLRYENVNQLEGQLNTQRDSFKPYMLCFKNPKTVNIANNLVQSGTNRYSNLQENTVEYLNNKYLSGYQISTNNLYGMRMNTPTFEYNYIWEKE